MFEDYKNLSDKTKLYFEKARKDASRDAFCEIMKNDFVYKAQYSSGFLSLPEREFEKNTIIETQTVGIDIKTTNSVINCRHSRYDIYKSLELDKNIKKSDNTSSLSLFLNLHEGCDIMIGKRDGTVKYLATVISVPFYSNDFYHNNLQHRRHITNLLEAPPGIRLTKNFDKKYNDKFLQWEFD